MAKPAVVGECKPFLTLYLSPDQAAQIHAAMLECMLARAGRIIASNPIDKAVLCINEPHRDAEVIPIHVPHPWQRVPQGAGDPGERMAAVWQQLGGQHVAFLNADSPDISLAALEAIPTAIDLASVALGRTDVGGYWTLAARQFNAKLLTGIDWGGPSVYHQTHQAAVDEGCSVAELPAWFDVDHPPDLTALRERIADATDPDLILLSRKLDAICGTPPGSPP